MTTLMIPRQLLVIKVLLSKRKSYRRLDCQVVVMVAVIIRDMYVL